ncbi:hypothetical protein D3C85_1348730 [compost metagenome]
MRQVAIIFPASSAVVSKATPILPASSAKPISSARGILACPAAATMAAKPSAAIGIRVVSVRMSSDICANCWGVSKSTTLRTSSMASSKLTAMPPAAISGAAVTMPAPTADMPAPCIEPAIAWVLSYCWRAARSRACAWAARCSLSV